MSSLFKNKKGYSPSITWVYGLVSLFGIGVLYIVFSQVFTAHLVPVIKNQVLIATIDNTTKTDIIGNIDKYMTFFNMMPFVLFGTVVLYMIVSAFRKEQMEQF